MSVRHFNQRVSKASGEFQPTADLMGSRTTRGAAETLYCTGHSKPSVATDYPLKKHTRKSKPKDEQEA
ncbi:hypothetical protein E2C01_082612 [Portunus trituberculatus]|uniref:Uncharacterized protein n=1 Tax=Portunus trituberculatus TaxID=210409 RepID=A0A5B7IZL1_PORTR|nr:hypothetical protein [Portunus trituberculatus]